MRFGLNYVPRKNWWYAWADWDGNSVADDFRAIADLGADHLRIQCLWPQFQPGIDYISPMALDRLHEMMDLAANAQLDVEVTVLDGWLSGYAFLPAWVSPLAADSAYNIFTHPDVIQAEKRLFAALANTIGKHPRFLGFDLGNEIGVLPSLNGLNNKITPDQADRWATTMLNYCESIAPGKLHVNGADHSHWFSDFGFSRRHLATAGSATVLHCYAYWSGALELYRYDQDGNLHLLEYMVELAKAYQSDPGRMVWVEEVGTSNEWMPEDYLPEYATRLLSNAFECGNLWGFTWWCSHDIDPAMKGFLSLEYTLGLLDQKNRIKPIGKTIAKLAQELRRTPPSPIDRELAIVVPDQKPGVQSETRDYSILKQFISLLREGHRAAIVLESRSHDENHLRARGIKDLVKLNQSA
jgi:endo-1,4-beta-mannosidase